MTSSPAPLKVLIVEDTSTVAALVQVFLMGWNLDFQVARNGKEGLERALAQKPDLVLSDVQMPELDGFGLCAAMRADPGLYAVPVVLLTSLKDDASRSQGRLVGATAFLSKPVTSRELRQQVATLLKLNPDTGKPA